MIDKIIKLMNDNNVTAYKLAKDINIPQTTISNWKTRNSKPNIETLNKIANYFNKPIEFFLDNKKNAVIIGKGAEPETINISNESKKELEELIKKNILTKETLTQEEIKILKEIVKLYKAMH